MRIPLESELIRQCAPTLAGLKPASLFRFVFPSLADSSRLVASLSLILAPKNIGIELLQFDVVRRSGLLFVYRPDDLKRIVSQDSHRDFFKRQGYSRLCWQDILAEISLRMTHRASFPHEIGILLGYPLDDVEAYMAAPRKKGLCSGCWKAYSQPARARLFFEKCRKCTLIYCRCYASGIPLSRLAVA
ncbi:MAG: DUF3793 family protein [Acidaminococcus sp.]|jgi:hypothetical protein|nr:DUF3793 family protein [Acidaminococcus sp.]MCI2100051.1 DUF3793 family protein [Acidaminococcus sp.]MCI2114351.1 DUF3793 family protein [Acidaminococcus sp.]MCI2116262.1 DUF3793 family protein [Acidaminococcus sp.]